MAKPGRNDPCPCGSGNKYKKCCLAKEEAVAREQLVKAQAPRDTLRRDQRAAADRLQVTELTAAVAARLARAEEEDAYEDALDIASNAVGDLVRAAKLDEAEAAARDLLRRFPDMHDGWDRLGMVHEARGDRQPAGCRLLPQGDRIHQGPPRRLRARLRGSVRQARGSPRPANRNLIATPLWSCSTRAQTTPPLQCMISPPANRSQVA